METILADLADHIEWPHAPVLDRVPGRLAESQPEPPRRRRWIPVTATLVVLVAALLVLSPQAREAVADLLGVAGIEIELRPELEEPVGAGLDLGREVAIGDVVESAGFAVSVPALAGEPDAVYLSEDQVNMVWVGGESLPAGGDTGVGLLYTQFPSESGGVRFVKGVGSETTVVAVEVAGASGLWIEGDHVISVEDESGRRIEETLRLAGNVLMWESDDVTHRIETAVGLEETLRIAESVEPIAS
ncbi:MAG TPA: hypothetical protein VMS99_07325 [Acidimicrobiia bacterium]|nr:hypothetical protein [Acidimicrobiia bacterium]